MGRHDQSWLTVEEVRSRLAYDPETGRLTWKRMRHTSRIGQETKSLDAAGYVQVNIAGTVCKGHRLAWVIHYGEWPAGDIDHINGIRNDNRIANLRAVTNQVNCQNKRAALPASSTGVLGVSFQAGKYRAQIQVDGKQIYLGRFKNIEAARDAYLEAKRIHHEGCTI